MSPFEDSFEYTQAAEVEHSAGNYELAESLFEEAISKARSEERDDLFYALAQYGQFLSQIGRHTDAIKVLEDALQRGKGYRSLYSILMKAYFNAGRIEDGYGVLDRRALQYPEDVESSTSELLRFALSQARSGAVSDAIASLIRAEQWAQHNHLEDQRFMLWGERGHLVERAESPVAAEVVYRAAVDSGSRDRKTFTRLLMILEKSGKYREARDLANHALNLQRNVAWEVDLRKRLARIESRLNSISGSKKVIPAFSIRFGDQRVELIDQRKFKYPVRGIALSPDQQSALFTLGTSKADNTLLLDLESDEVIWSTQLTGKPYWLPNDSILVVNGIGRVNRGRLELTWISRQGETLHSTVLPDLQTQVRIGGELIVIGCRDGYLYTFDLGGDLLWKHAVPSSGRDWSTGPYPHTLDVARNGKAIVYTYQDHVTYLDSEGHVLWRWNASLNDVGFTHSKRSDSGDDTARDFGLLGVKQTVSDEEIQAAFRKCVHENHPDLNQDDANAAENFYAVLRAFEAIMVDRRTTAEIQERSIANRPGLAYVDGVLISEDGSFLLAMSRSESLSLLDHRGRVVSRFLIEGSVGSVAVDSKVSRVAYAHSDGISFYQQGVGLAGVHNIDDVGNAVSDLKVSDDDRYIAVTHRPYLHLFNMDGHRLADLEFSGNISSVVFRGNSEIMVAMGELVRFRIVDYQ